MTSPDVSTKAQNDPRVVAAREVHEDAHLKYLETQDADDKLISTESFDNWADVFSEVLGELNR